MSDLSKMVTDRVKSANSVLAAGQAHRANIVAKLDAAYAAGAAAGELLDKLMTSLSKDSQHIQDTDLAHAGELSDDAGPRSRRDQLTDNVHNTLVQIRSFVRANFGPETEQSLGFGGHVPNDPMEVLRLSELVMTQLPQTDLSKPLIPLVQVSSADLSVMLKADSENLASAIKHVSQESREAEATLIAKRQATAAFDKTFSLTATLCSNLLSIAGETELAGRIRPSSRRPGQTAEITEGDGAETSESAENGPQ